MVGRLSPTGSPTSAVTKLPSGKHATTARESAVDQTISEDGSVVRVKAQVMTRSDEGWVLVDGGGVSLVGVFRRCVQVPIAPSFSLLPAQAQSQTQGQAQTRVRSSKEDKKSQKEFLDEPDSAIECSGADDDKTDTCRVQCYECTEFRIRAHRIKDGHVSPPFHPFSNVKLSFLLGQSLCLLNEKQREGSKSVRRGVCDVNTERVCVTSVESVDRS